MRIDFSLMSPFFNSGLDFTLDVAQCEAVVLSPPGEILKNINLLRLKTLQNREARQGRVSPTWDNPTSLESTQHKVDSEKVKSKDHVGRRDEPESRVAQQAPAATKQQLNNATLFCPMC